MKQGKGKEGFDMVQVDRFRVGMIGFGVAKLYAAALRSIPLYYPDLPPVDLAAVATATEKSGEAAMKHFGFERRTTNYHEILDDKDINTVVIASPPHLHREMTIAALQAGKYVYLDKPLANNFEEAQKIVAASQASGRDAQLIFEYRHAPAVMTAKRMIAEGRLGDLYSFRIPYFRSSNVDVTRPAGWKGEMAKAGGGSLNDTAPHAIDLALWLAGMPDRVTATTRIFVKERPRSKADPQMVPVETDDHVIVQMEKENGFIGTIEASKLIVGAVNDIQVEVYGSKGSLRWNIMDPNYLEFAEANASDLELGWRRIPTVQRYPDAAIPGYDLSVGMMRFHIASLASFLRNTLEGKPYDPGLMQGLRVQAVVEAALKAAHDRCWVDVAKV